MATPKTKLFVGHLPEECTSEELQELFEKYGTVTECDVLNKYGFVHMSTSEEADDALKALNNYNLKGCSISVEHSNISAISLSLAPRCHFMEESFSFACID